MDASEKLPVQENGYLLNPENATEMARLMLQDRLINEIVGGPFPELEELESIDSILDIGCGPGGWALDIARSYPKKEIIGIDISTMMLAYASEQKKLHGLKNIYFKKMDARQELEFPDRSFALVNIRAATGYISRQIWPQLLKECARITRIGGILRVTEADRVGLTNSAPFEKYAEHLGHLISKMKYGFAVDARTAGMSPMLGKLLQDAGYKDVQMRSYVLDFSYGAKFYPVQLQNIEITFQLLQPRLIEMGIVTQEELEKLYDFVIHDMNSETFCGTTCLLTFYGKI